MTAARRAVFHPLRLAGVDRLTDDAVALSFAVPERLRSAYAFLPGQHIAVRQRSSYAASPPVGGRKGTGAEIRRTYSICSPATDRSGPRTLRVGVRRVEGGAFSTYALKEATVGDVVEVMTPTGRFTLEPRPGRFAAIVGGSGITPVLSMAATSLAARPDSTFCLVRSDRSASSTMFVEEVAELKDRYPDRFQFVSVLSREGRQSGPASGRLDAARIAELLPALLPVNAVDSWFVCGPYGLLRAARDAFQRLGVPRSTVHQETFFVSRGEQAGSGTVNLNADDHRSVAPLTGGSAGGAVAVTLNGWRGGWPTQEGEPLLETVLRHRPDAPYACKGGVCGTCRAFLVSGQVRMASNFALEPEEVEAGYVLACQSRPSSAEVEIDFDR